MGQELGKEDTRQACRISETVPIAPPEAPTSGSEQEIAAELDAICAVVHQSTGHDFSRYKQPTLLRRIRRRVLLHQSSVAEYVRLLQQSPAEAEELRRDLLIGVTHFFRDQEAFEALASQVFPALVNRANPPSIRIWVPGCASGEEAYSLAILTREQLARASAPHQAQILATDIDGELIQIARQGRYPLTISEHVSPERLAQYFVRDGDFYQVSRELRTICTFSEHSLIRDPPFSSIDLVSCRNVLIYLGVELQRSLVPLFHYALRRGGHLLLGPSESLAAHMELFATVDKRVRLFRRNDAVARSILEFPLMRRVPGHIRTPVEAGVDRAAPPLLNHAFERMIIEDYAPACAVINEHGDILYSAGRMGRYLQVAAGQPSHNIGDLARGAFGLELRNAVQRATKTQRRVIRDRLELDLGGEIHLFRLIVRPLPGMPANSGLYVLVLQPIASPDDGSVEPEEDAAPGPAIIEQLENELRTVRMDLQYAEQNLESATEELKSSNEELRSTNEELKSTNEELQTSQEELQSVNAELEAANCELELKVQELAKSNADLANLFASTQIAALFLDAQLRIRRFTPAAAQLLSLIDADVGRPIGDFRPPFADHDLLTDVRAVLSSSVPLERQVHSTEGHRWFVLRVLPYRAEGGAPEGVTVAVVDITELKEAEEAARQREHLLRAVTETAPDPVFLKDREGRMLLANPATLAAIGKTSHEVLGKTAREFHDDPGTGEAIMQNDSRVMDSGEIEVIEERVATHEGTRTYLSTKAPYRDGGGHVIGLVGLSRDITQRKRVEEALRETSLRLQLALHTAKAASWDRDMATGRTVWSPNAFELMGLNPGTEISFELWRKLVHPDDLAALEADISRALRERSLVDCTYRIVTPSGTIRWINAVGQGVYDGTGKLERITGLWWDVTDHVLLEEARLREQERLARTQRLESLATLARGIAHDFNNLLGAFFGNVTLAMDAHKSGDAGSTTTYLDDALKTMDRARGLTQQLITFARGGEPVRVLTDMATFVRETMLFSLSGSNLLPDLRAPSELWLCELDQTQIGQVIDNLIINAREAMPTGGILRIDLENWEGPATSGGSTPKRYVCLTVTDNGPGIAPEHMGRIFDPFFSTKSGNTGLGLATSYSIVQRHGGHIEVDSHPGGGASFRVYLPALGTTPQEPLATPVAEIDLTGRRVLVMDDHPQICSVTAKLLQRWGATVSTVPGGEAALAEFETARAQGNSYDFVILDLTIPGERGGADVLARMRSADPGVRAIAASGYADDPIVSRPTAFGFAAALAKPHSSQEMAAAIATTLQLKHRSG